MGREWKEVSKEVARYLLLGRLEEAWLFVERALGEGLAAGESPDDAAELDFLYRATQLAAQYGEGERARAWIGSHRERRGKVTPLSETLERAYQVVELGVHWVLRDYGSMETRLGDLDWKQVPSWAWTYNLQLSLAVTRNDRAEVLNLLRRPSPAVGSSPDFRDNYQQGSRLRLLGFYHFERGDMRRSLGCFRAALRCYARDETVDARLKEIDIFGHWGKAAFREGRLSESERYLRRAIRAAGRFKYRLGYHTYRHELAHVYALGGQLERAERMALGITRGPARRGSGSGREHFLLVKCILSAGHFAVDGGEARKAARHAALARSLLEESGHPRLPGYLHLLDARVEAMGASEAAYARALEKFELAAVSFRAFGDGDMPGLSLLAYYRGHVHIQRHDVKAALAEAVECMEIAKRSGFLPARSASLLLKSQLLLQRELPNADRLYEEVLRDLGSIHDKVVLFKVIANLYLYSWELGEQLDLTDWHMKQIRRMQEILDRETFHCLYERYVTRPVFHRALVRALGHGDQSFTAPGAESSYAAP